MLIQKTVISSIYGDDNDFAWAMPEGMVLYDVRPAPREDGDYYDHDERPVVITFGTLADIVAAVPGCRFIPAPKEDA
jgi:hypothetical protein